MNCECLTGPRPGDDLMVEAPCSALHHGEPARVLDAVVSMVTDDPASRAVWYGPAVCWLRSWPPMPRDRMFHALVSSGFSNSVPKLPRQGMRYLDAPVTGLPETAVAGELTLLLGADPKT